MPSVEIPIEGRDLILAKGYSQSNRGRWCTIGWPTTPDRWRRLGAAGVAGAHRSSVLHGYGAPFSVFSLPTEPVECEELTKGVFYRWGGGSRAGHAVARFKPQPPAMVGEHSKGRLTTRLGQMGAAQNIEHRL
jgi:hypothetical protein